MMLAPLDVDRATAETVAYLQRLVRFNTTNPPGNETECARWIADLFEAEGIPAEVVEPAPGRGSVLARLRGTGVRRPLLLLSHLDVVPAVAADWEHDPFGGEVIDGEVWGRGTLDMKSLTAIWMTVMLEAKRRGLALERDLVFLAAADEEMLGTWGAKWLVDNRPELAECEFALNEGGGDGREFGGVVIYTYQPAEKSACWVRLTAHGTAGHGSIPHADNPVVHLAGAIHKLGTTQLPFHATDTFREFVEKAATALPGQLGDLFRLTLEESTAESVLASFPDPFMADVIRAMSHNTAAPTCLAASDKTNVIPQTATAMIDCRILPGQTPEMLLAELRAVLGLTGAPGEKLVLEVADPEVGPTESPLDTELTRVIERAMAVHAPGSPLVPILMTGATDSRFFRERGVVCYGFHPALPDVDPRTVHGKNERISVASLEFGVKVLWDVVTGVAAGA